MKFSLSWLSDHIKLNSEIDIDQISRALTNMGLEVESIENPSLLLEKFLIGKILEVNKHPNADRLTICKVDIGNKACEVVCGAPNVVKNMKVVFAPIGAKIPSSGLVLKKKEIRGVKGEGMLCSEKELNIGEDANGIIELDRDAPVGKLFVNWKKTYDYIFDIAITPNRGDCASVKGIARELSAVGLGQLIDTKYTKIKGGYKSPIKWEIDLDKKNEHLVPYVKGRYFRGLKNIHSPEWLQKKLISIGLKPISALVDLTNYLTFDIGRPLHVFDASKIKGNLKMRMAKNNEKIIALDGNEYSLNNKNLIIADDLGPKSIAGVMGGIDSCCDMNTIDMFLESALFDKGAVAYNGRSLNIISDARYRFERGVDPNSVDIGVEIFSNLVLEICGGEASEEVFAGLLSKQEKTIKYRPSQLLRIGGIKLDIKSQKKQLERLGFQVVNKNNYLEVISPPWRNDINVEADLVEEILRISGYENIKSKFLTFDHRNFKAALNLTENRAKIARDTLARRGLLEVVTFSFLSPKDSRMFLNGSNMVKLENPISEDLSVMRPSLLPNLINYLSKNIRNGFFNNGIFEVSSVFLGENIKDQKICISAVREGIAGSRHWATKERNVDIYDIKLDAIEVLNALGVDETKIKLLKKAPSWYHPGKSGTFSIGKFDLGYFGEIHPQIAQFYKLKVVCFEMFLENIPGRSLEKPKSDFKFYSVMPIRRDFAFLLDEEVMSNSIVNCIRKIGTKNKLVDVLEVSVFDVYQEDSSKKEKSIGVEVLLQPLISTLNEKQIIEVSENIISQVRKETGAILRT